MTDQPELTITDSSGNPQQADSQNEVYLALAMHKLNIQFLYRFSIHGGSQGLRGGLEVDFVLLFPFKRPVELFGEYWHKGQLGADDRLKLAQEYQYFEFETIVIWGVDTDTMESALAIARKELR
jgi:hypothetical protein